MRTYALVSFLALTSLLLIACTDAVGAILGSDRPGDLTASTGDYPDRIELSWDAVEDKESEDGETIPVTGYEVQRDPQWAIGDNTRQTSTESYSDDENITPATPYTYRVRAVYSSGPEGSWTIEDVRGYALATTSVRIYSQKNASKGAVSYNASSADRWFDFVAQEGWVYRLYVTDAATALAVFRKGDIENEITVTDEGEGVYSLRASRTGVYHTQLRGGSGTFSVSHR